MKAKSNRWLLCCTPVLVLGLLVTSCTTGPAPPQPGSPAFYWAAAIQTYRVGDYMKTNDNLGQVTRSENEFKARAQPWELIVSAGLVQAFMDLADRYEAGARANRANPTAFRKEVAAARTSASSAVLQFAEAFHRFLAANKDQNIALAFDYPTGNLAEPPQLTKVAKGMMIQPADVESIQREMLQRGVLMSACRAVGAPDDPAKALEIFKKGDVQVPRNVFLLAMANSLYAQSQLFGRNKLDQPNRTKLLCDEAMEALKTLPPTKQTKELSKKIENALKARQ